MSSKHASQFVARRGTRLGTLAGEDERWVAGAAKTRHANHACALGRVARIVIVDDELAGIRSAIFPVHLVPCLAQERSVLEKVGALLAAQPYVDFLQMAVAVVTRNAG